MHTAHNTRQSVIDHFHRVYQERVIVTDDRTLAANTLAAGIPAVFIGAPTTITPLTADLYEVTFDAAIYAPGATPLERVDNATDLAMELAQHYTIDTIRPEEFDLGHRTPTPGVLVTFTLTIGD